MSALRRGFLAVLSCFPFISTVYASDITTYEDGNCQRSFINLNVVNGYPDGVCTPLSLSKTGSPSSFQIAKLDSGCAVTIYGANEGPLTCSSSTKIVAEMGTCYNATWVYYSVDGCLSPKSTPTVISTTTPTLAPNSKPPTSAASSTASSSSPSPSSGPPESPTPTRTIIIGITGGVASLGVFFGLFLFLARRRQQRLQRNMNKPLPSIPAYELPNDGALIEAAHRSIPVAMTVRPMKADVDQHMEAVEIGRNSAYEARMEWLRDGGWKTKLELERQRERERERREEEVEVRGYGFI